MKCQINNPEYTSQTKDSIKINRQDVFSTYKDTIPQNIVKKIISNGLKDMLNRDQGDLLKK